MHCVTRTIALGLAILATLGLAGMLSPAASAAAGQNQNAAGPSNKAATGQGQAVGDVNMATWMHDLAPHIKDRTLGQIVIPGSHDSGTYGIPAPDDDLWHTQSDDFIHQLNDGMRQFDIRTGYKETGNATLNQPSFDGCCDPNYYVYHGVNFWLNKASTWLTLDRVFSDIETWAKEPGHDQEILILNLSIDAEIGYPSGNQDPNIWFNACQSFGQQMGDALVTPGELWYAYGTTDPGKVTLGDLWSLPDPKGYARVLLYNPDCLAAASPGPAPGYWAPEGSYYADQCSYSGISVPEGNQWMGMHDADLRAVKTRATGSFNNFGPPSSGALYNLGIMGTPEFGCLYTPTNMVPDEERVLAALYQQWQTDPATRANLNIISGDFFQRTDLMKDVIAMDGSFPLDVTSITKVAPLANPVRLVPDEEVGGFSVRLTSSRGEPVPGQQVTFTISPAEAYQGQWLTPHFAGGYGPGTTPTSVVSTDSSGIALSDKIDTGSPFAGDEYTLTASTPLLKDVATWTLDIETTPKYTLEPDANDPTTVQVTGTLQDGFAVKALDDVGQPVSGAPVTFDATGVGAFPDGPKTVVKTGSDGLATSPAFTAGTRAGKMAITVESAGAPTVTLPITVTAGSPDRFVPTTAKEQPTQINSTLPAGWAMGHWVDKYANVLINVPAGYNELSMDVDPSAAAWPNGKSTIDVTPTDDGTITAPELHIGPANVRNDLDGIGSIIVYVGHSLGGEIAVLHVSPGPPHDVTIKDGDGQQTNAGQAFAKPLAVKVTDAGNNPIPGASVLFQVTSGQATFALPPGAAGYVGKATPAALPPNTSAEVDTDANGVATAPTLTAGQQGGPIEVTATAGQASTVFHLSATGVAPGAPTITGVTNGDGQVGVTFSDANPGTSPITSYEVKATDQSQPNAAPVTAPGQSSPLTVSGLTNGDPYVFSVTATSASGTSPPSATYGPLNVGVPPKFTAGPAKGVVGQPYSSGLTVTGAPPPTITVVSGLPPGLTLGSDGKLTGTPTQAGTYDLTVHADNHVGQADDTVPVQVEPASAASTTPSTTTPATTTPTTTTPTSTVPANSAPTITNLANGDGQVAVSFSTATTGTSPVSSYEVSATDLTKPGTPPVTAKGQSSPITVTGLTNGDSYQFTVMAINPNGDGQVAVSFSTATTGTSPVSSYEVSATDLTTPGTPPVTAKGQSSPIEVSGLSSGDSYQFTVMAINPNGASGPISVPSGQLTVGVGQSGKSGPANGVGSQSSKRGKAGHQPPRRHAHGHSRSRR